MSHALIFGASGVSGWALASQTLTYPSASTFSRVTALTNRPLSHADSFLPADPRLSLVSGIDLTGSLDSIVSALRSKVPSVGSVTHVFFTAYIHHDDHLEAVRINTALVRTAIAAVDQLAGGSLRSVILQTGGKHYGVEFPDKVDIKAPLLEDAARLPPGPEADKIFYYKQVDALQELSRGKAWRFYEIRPDVIVGFVPGSNFMNVAQGLGLYFSLYKAVHGEGAEVPFIGSPGGWKCRHTDTSQDILAKQEIFVAINGPEKGVESGTAFNCADSGEPVTWEQKWPVVAAWFGLKGVGPRGDGGVDVAAFAKENAGRWKEVEQREGLKEGVFEKYMWSFLPAVCSAFDFDRWYDLKRSRELGFKEEVKTVDGYTLAFERMRKAKILP